ncbi:unnamed protein product, partial [Ranitomeya imitator]
MAPTGTVSQPVLIPITIPGQMSGQQGLALWNFPTTTLATIPGLAAAPPAGGMFKLPLANLQAAPVLNTALQTPVQAAPALQAIYQAQPAVQAQAALQATVQPQAALQVPTTLQAQTAMVSSNVVKSDPPTHLTVQPASFTFNPAIDGNQGKHRVTKRGPALSYPMFTLVTGIVGRWRAIFIDL